MSFISLTKVHEWGVDKIKEFLEEHSKSNDARGEVWDGILVPFFSDMKDEKPPRFMSDPVWVPYGSNPLVPINDVGNAIGYIICTAALEQRGNALSIPLFEWAKNLAASYAVILITLCKDLAKKKTPSMVHILWTDSQNIKLQAELPAGSPFSDIYSAMGSALPTSGALGKGEAQELRAKAILTELKNRGFPEAAEFARTFKGHNPPGNCAEVLPFLSIIAAVPPRPENRVPVFAFALKIEEIELLMAKGSPKASDIHRHGFYEACPRCQGLMKSISVNYNETHPVKDDDFNMEAPNSTSMRALVLRSNGDHLWSTSPGSEEVNRNRLRDFRKDLPPDTFPESLLPNKVVALSTDDVILYWDVPGTLATFVAVWAKRSDTLLNTTMHHGPPDAAKKWLSTGLLAGSGVAALGLLATFVMGL